MLIVALANALEKLEAEKPVQTLGDLESEALDYTLVGKVEA